MFIADAQVASLEDASPVRVDAGNLTGWHGEPLPLLAVPVAREQARVGGCYRATRRLRFADRPGVCGAGGGHRRHIIYIYWPGFRS